MIVTPLDSATLDSKKQYNFYHKMVDFILKEVVVTVQQQQLCTAEEMKLFKQYCDLLLYSIEAMRVKYMYNEDENLKVDLTDSGFPNYLEFRYLFNDLELREEFLGRLTHIDDLKAEFLDTLLKKKKAISKRRLFQAASIVYYTSAKKEFIFNRFVQGKILSLNSSKTSHMVSWSFYDVSLNRPFICFLYFNYDGKAIDDYKAEIYNVLKAVADRKMPLETMLYGIDKRLPKLFPKRLKRIDLGPIHNVFAKDENQLTHVLLEAIANKTVPLASYAVSLHVDEIASAGTITEGGFFNKTIFQKWQQPFQKYYVFAPHRIIQLLHNKAPEIIDQLHDSPIEMATLANGN